MVLLKKKPQHGTLSGRENDGNRDEVLQRNSLQADDHWDFLDEIEAPMWADLTLEAESTYQDNEDEWFHISHPFHQCSSRQLISAFSHSEEGCTNSEFGTEGPSSPKLPPSVSRSRGKHLKSREWVSSSQGFTLNKRYPVKNLSSKCSCTNSGSDKEIKSKSNNGNPREHVGSKAGSICESSLTETAGPNYSKPTPSLGDSQPHSSSLAIKGGESNTTSTITSESCEQQQQNSLEVSSQMFGHTNGLLLSTLRISLRKSCVARQASRVKINGERPSEGSKSASSKSSVGSSSITGNDVKNLTFTTTQNKEKTPDSRNVMKMSQARKNKGKVLNVSKAPAVPAQDIILKSRWQSEVIASKSINKKAAKTKVTHNTARPKVLLPRKVNEHDPSTAATKAKGKLGAGQYNRLARGGKENATGRIALGQKCNTSEKVAEGIVQVQKETRWSLL